MALAITPLHPHIGAEIGGLDLSRPLDRRRHLAELWRAIDRHAVLVFHDQQISDQQLHDFAARFGELEIGRSAALQGGRRRLSIPQIGDISNLDEDNRLRARDDRRRLDSLGNRLWHTDASYMPVPVVLGMLFAVAVPPASPFGGGETEFADMRAAYDALSDEQKAVDRSADRRARHVLVARPDRLYRIPARRAREIPALAPAPGAAAPRFGPQMPVPVGACLAHRRLAGRRMAASCCTI